ncbi:MAG: ABC transporter permease [Alphaproteobacteria bacterium]
MNIQFNTARFKSNKRSVWGLWIFSFLLIISLLAKFIANDKPLLVSYKQKLYSPLFFSYSEQEFGGDFETEANYRDPHVKNLIQSKGWMLWAPIPYSYDTVNYELDRPAPSAPTTDNWLGTDDQGRDLLARLIYGTQFSIFFGLSVIVISALIGFFMGAVQGYFGGYVDLILQRFMEIWSGLPVLFILIILSSLTAPTFGWLLLIISLFQWMILVPIVRVEFLKTRNFEYVKAAKAMGIPSLTIILGHILPNIIGAPLSLIPFMLTLSISLLTTLDFLGIGLPLGSPSLGEILHQGKNNLHAPWIGISGFTTLSLLLCNLIFIGEGIRDGFRTQTPQPMEGL